MKQLYVQQKTNCFRHLELVEVVMPLDMCVYEYVRKNIVWVCDKNYLLSHQQ